MATETEAAGAAGHAAESAGMPQLDFATFPNQIFWLVVALVAIYLLLTRVALPRIGSILAERRGLIAGDVAVADELKQKAVAADKAYHQALADARSEAARIIAAAKAEIQKDLDVATAKADAELAVQAGAAEARIAEIRESAVSSVTEVARDTAEAIVASFRNKADAATIGAAVTARLKG